MTIIVKDIASTGAHRKPSLALLQYVAVTKRNMRQQTIVGTTLFLGQSKVHNIE